MPALIELGYVVERQSRWEGARPGDVGRFITPADRELLKALGRTEEHKRRFIEAAREAEASENEADFDAAMKRIARPRKPTVA
ncbi:hypothetical protein [Methylobacterium sp. J-068]|uniref:hypothetical protein n=1 Tax=Methylobacterium sp. J-068 TaxID=2836649 RepID=UPI001FBAEAE3|nr:hypothetical protein [Methylobacterium sp. J-068]MCJ2033263.1 hypothetical protein [Methylobacterium sp. J-068]